jgi:hypothetical protein
MLRLPQGDCWPAAARGPKAATARNLATRRNARHATIRATRHNRAFAHFAHFAPSHDAPHFAHFAPSP